MMIHRRTIFFVSTSRSLLPTNARVALLDIYLQGEYCSFIAMKFYLVARARGTVLPVLVLVDSNR